MPRGSQPCRGSSSATFSSQTPRSIFSTHLFTVKIAEVVSVKLHPAPLVDVGPGRGPEGPIGEDALELRMILLACSRPNCQKPGATSALILPFVPSSRCPQPPIICRVPSPPFCLVSPILGLVLYPQSSILHRDKRPVPASP